MYDEMIKKLVFSDTIVSRALLMLWPITLEGDSLTVAAISLIMKPKGYRSFNHDILAKLCCFL